MNYSKKTCIVIIVILIILIISLLFNLYKDKLTEHYYSDPLIDNIIEKLIPFFNQDKVWGKHLEMLNKRDIMSEVSFRKGNKSYTINKEYIYICLRDESKQPYPMNMLMYVALHELSHALCDEYGHEDPHTEKFHNIFDALLEEAYEYGIYDKNIPIIRNYCGHD